MRSAVAKALRRSYGTRAATGGEQKANHVRKLVTILVAYKKCTALPYTIARERITPSAMRGGLSTICISTANWLKADPRHAANWKTICSVFAASGLDMPWRAFDERACSKASRKRPSVLCSNRNSRRCDRRCPPGEAQRNTLLIETTFSERSESSAHRTWRRTAPRLHQRQLQQHLQTQLQTQRQQSQLRPRHLLLRQTPT